MSAPSPDHAEPSMRPRPAYAVVERHPAAPVDPPWLASAPTVWQAECWAPEDSAHRSTIEGTVPSWTGGIREYTGAGHITAMLDAADHNHRHHGRPSRDITITEVLAAAQAQIEAEDEAAAMETPPDRESAAQGFWAIIRWEIGYAWQETRYLIRRIVGRDR